MRMFVAAIATRLLTKKHPPLKVHASTQTDPESPEEPEKESERWSLLKAIRSYM